MKHGMGSDFKQMRVLLLELLLLFLLLQPFIPLQEQWYEQEQEQQQQLQQELQQQHPQLCLSHSDFMRA